MKNLFFADIPAETIKAALIKSEMFNETVQDVKDEASTSAFSLVNLVNDDNATELKQACWSTNRLHDFCIELQKLIDGGK